MGLFDWVKGRCGRLVQGAKDKVSEVTGVDAWTNSSMPRTASLTRQQPVRRGVVDPGRKDRPPGPVTAAARRAPALSTGRK
jgi:hypothetical protein